MKKAAFIIGMGLLLVVLVPLGWFVVFRYHSSPDVNVAEIDLRDGDLILRRGRSIESFAVVVADKDKDYSHIGIVAMDDGKPYVIHVVPGESDTRPELVIKESPESFLCRKKATGFAVYRSVFPEDSCKKVALKALGYHQNRIAFDHEYDLQSDQKLYCTELVLRAYQELKLDTGFLEYTRIRIFLGEKSILMPGIFAKSPQFYQICQY
jgi:hypothetical protein